MFERMSAGELSRLIRAKEAKPSEICADLLARAGETEPKVNAYITLGGDAAMTRAKELDDVPVSAETPAMFGIPVAVKDNICTKDMPTTCASKMLSNFRPPYDAGVVTRLREQGAIILGKTNMDEFAMGSSCETSFYGATRNPHDLERVPGGSSGGSAAAVAAGSAVVALGSDTGGSIRLPAAFCGAVGYKPSYGAVSRYGLLSYASSFDQIGPIARTVTDAAMAVSAIGGWDAMDATSSPKFTPKFSEIENFSLKGRKIGIPREYFSEGIGDDVRKAVIERAEACRSLGAELVDISLPMVKHSLSIYYIIASAEASSNLAKYDGIRYGYRAEGFEDLDELYTKTRTEGFGDEVKRRIMLGTYVLSSGYYDAYYKRARIAQAMLRDEFKRAFEQCDVILTPVSPNTAFRIGERIDDPIAMYMTDICTVSVNIAGLSAISVPCARDSAGLPISLQLIGKRFEDGELLGFARAIERETGLENLVAEVK